MIYLFKPGHFLDRGCVCVLEESYQGKTRPGGKRHDLKITFLSGLKLFQKGKNANSRQNCEQKLPQVPPEIMRIASERHQKGLMSPWIYQALSQVSLSQRGKETIHQVTPVEAWSQDQSGADPTAPTGGWHSKGGLWMRGGGMVELKLNRKKKKKIGFQRGVRPP